VRNGPFRRDAFARLPRRNWTLLVQDCDKWFAAAEDLLRHFAFIPRWRVDDVMASYAVDGGSVGAHVDQYDVFLVQAQGRRRWRISTDPAAPKDFRPNEPLKLLRAFAPTHEWVLEPGDALYLPPGVPHHGVAVGECITCSVGMRAPSATELLMAFAASLDVDETRRYADPDLKPAGDAGELDRAAAGRAGDLLERLVRELGPERGDWLGRFLTRYRSSHAASPARRRLAPAILRRRLASGARLELSPWARALYQRTGREATLFVAGDAYSCSLALARRLTENRIVGAAAARSLGPRDWATLASLCNDGHAGIGP
jgi:50S ribosomal protein L16 3-hydroxylase